MIDPPPPPSVTGEVSPPFPPDIPPNLTDRTIKTGIQERVGNLFQRLGFSRPGIWFWVLALGVLVEAVVLSWTQVQAYHSYYTFSQDFGSFNQSFHTALFNGRLFFYTANLPSGNGGTYFAVHFAPLLFVLLPFYALAPAPTTLLVIKEVALALGAFPVYGIAQRRLRSARWGFAFGLAYLLSPIVLTLDWTSFDMEVFLPFLVLSAFYFATVRRPIPFFVFWGLALATIETIAPLLGLCALMGLIGAIWGPGLRGTAQRRLSQDMWAGALLLTIAWYALAYLVVRSFNPAGGTFGTGYASHYTVLQATSFFDVLPQAFLHPDLAGAALGFGGPTKLVYVAILFGCLAFLTIFGELRYLLPIVLWLGLSLLSNFPPEYSLGSQYLGYVCPFLFAGAIGGAVYLRGILEPRATATASATRRPTPVRRPWTLPDPDRAMLPAALAISVLVALAIGNPLTGVPAAGLTSLQYGIASPDPHTELLDRTIALIPNGAGVMTTAHLFPQVSNRLNAYVLPTTQIFSGSNTYWGMLDQFVNNSSYVLLDFVLDPYPSEVILYYGDFAAFGVLVGADGVLLLERGWTGGPLPGYGTPTSTTYPASGLSANKLNEVPSNQTIFFRSFGASGTRIWQGPYPGILAPGVYDVNVTLRFHASSIGPLFTFRLQWTPYEIDAIQDQNTSAGHHYNYVFVHLPTVTVNLTTISSNTTSTSSWVTEVASLQYPLTTLGTLATLAATNGTTKFQSYVLDLTMTDVSPPPFLG
jgi:uncharacterized membrane protein